MSRNSQPWISKQLGAAAQMNPAWKVPASTITAGLMPELTAFSHETPWREVSRS